VETIPYDERSQTVTLRPFNQGSATTLESVCSEAEIRIDADDRSRKVLNPRDCAPIEAGALRGPDARLQSRNAVERRAISFRRDQHPRYG
jgi:hypothetical protein